jgi:hypothetical protein
VQAHWFSWTTRALLRRESGADPVKVADVVEDLLTVFEVKKLAGYVAEADGQHAVNTTAALADLGRLFPVPEGLASEAGQRWLAEFLVRLAQPADEEGDPADGSSS